jgi:WD40 repeat protein/dienelactone hydrolase
MFASLRASHRGLLALFVLFLGGFHVGFLPAAEPSDRPLTVDGDALIADYFRRQTAQISEPVFADIETLEDWQAQRPRRLAELREMLGLDPFPTKTPLEPVVTGQLDREGITVERLHFQAMPGLYVTGSLFRPQEVGEPLPAVLYVCGHGRVKEDGISYGNKAAYQHHGAWFAKHGYVCLMIDTIQLGEIEGHHHGTHRYGWWWWNNRGYTPAGVEAWNSIRAIDYLQSRPEVDDQRIGITGRSGGGAYSWWAAALDERIKVAVPVAGITSMQNHVVDDCIEGHCDCMFMVNTYRWDFPMLAAMVAPRPLLISNSDKDRIFPLDGVVDVYQKVQKIYRLYDAEDRLGLNITEGPHKDTQELRVPAFRWLNRFLKSDDALIRQPAEKIFAPEELRVFASLPADERVTTIHESFVPAVSALLHPDEQRGLAQDDPDWFTATVLNHVLGGGGFVWWQSNQADPIVDNGGNGNGGGSGTNSGGNGTQVVTQALRFEPADAQVKINGQPAELQNGTLKLERPESNQIYVEATHDSGQWELAKTYSWSELEALDFQIKLNRNAQSFVSEAWEELGRGKLDQAIALYANALRLNRALVDMPPPHWLQQHNSYVNDMALSSDDKWLASVSDGNENNAFAWQLQSTAPYATATALPGQEDLLEAVEISPDGRGLATGGAGGKVQLWQVGQFEKGAIVLTGVDQDVLALSFDSTSKYLAASSYGTAVAVWHLDRVPQQTTPQYTLDSHEEAVPAIAFVPKRNQLITGGWDDKLKLWRLPAPDMPSEGKLEPVDLQGPLKSDINVVAIDPAGNWLAVGTTENVVLWDLNKNEEGVELISRGFSIEALAFSPGGKYLAAADADGHVYSCVMEPSKLPEAVRQHEAHKGAVMALAFSPDGRLLASGGGDRRILLWDMQAPQLQPTELIGHTDSIRSLQFTSNPQWLISASDDGKLGLWQYGRWLVIDRALRTFDVGPTIEARRADRLIDTL